MTLKKYQSFQSVPFDTKKPLGYYTVLILQCLSGSSYVLVVSLFCGFYIGMCSYIGTLVTDLSTFADDINEISEKKQSAENQRKIDGLCSDMIQFHIDTLK